MTQLIGVDVGGTFTDLVWRDELTGAVVAGKQPTSSDAPELGALEAVAATLTGEQVSSASLFLHGTTVGLNALIERRGATIGLLCTRGFRDILEVRRGDRDDPYDLFWAPPPALVPRRLRIPIGERMLASGAVHRPLPMDEIGEALEVFQAEGVDAIAIAFMNAYANPAHELAAETRLRDLGFGGDISVSHRTSGEYREYERTCTTVIDAFVRRRIGPYLSRLDGELRRRGFAGDSLITRSGGGAMTFQQAAERPFETVISGPVAGAMATAELARELELPNAIAADVGGTSFDTCLIDHGRVPVLYQGEVIGLPLQAPWVDVRSIGAGGGSIARVDAGGLLRVGPDSAGSRPGPACYGRGGEWPTVTDALLVLGILPQAIAGGIELRRDLAEAALGPLAERLGYDQVREVARGIVQIVSAAMADAIRSVTVERGRDPREAALVAFGGAGPLFGTLLADELDIGTVVVPPLAGNFSAWGLLTADLTQTLSRTSVQRLTAAGVESAAALANQLFSQLTAPGAGDATERELHLDLRYRGQEHSLTVAAPFVEGRIAGGPDALVELFEAEYARTFGITMDEELELVCVRAVTRSPRERGGPMAPVAGGDGARGTTVAWSMSQGGELEFAVVDRSKLAAGTRLCGPAIVQEPTTTTYLDAGYMAEVHAGGALLIGKETA